MNNYKNKEYKWNIIRNIIQNAIIRKENKYINGKPVYVKHGDEYLHRNIEINKSLNI